MKQTKKQAMRPTAPATAPAAPQQTEAADPADISLADYEAMQEAERTHTITLHFTDEEWALIHEDIRRFTFQNGIFTPGPLFSEWLEAAKIAILEASARDCADDYDRMLRAAAAASKIGFAFEDRKLWR